MLHSVLLYILLLCFAVLMAMLCYLYSCHQKQKENIKQITSKLSSILNQNTDEKIMIFTDDKVIAGLIEQINCILEDRQKIHADYLKSEMSSKRMLSNISHDIKTPLTVILGYLEVLLLNSRDDSTMLKKVEDKAKQVMELINKFFTLAKIEAGDTDLSITRINLNEALKENIIDFYNLLNEKEFKVEVDLSKDDFFVYGNLEALNRIFTNLITNAIRYGKDGKYLGITLRTDEANAWIDITDHGKGIEKSSVANVFDRLYTLDDSRNMNLGGSGLGLAIAKSLAVKLGGDLSLISEPGIKTVFTLRLRKFQY